jgi:hypothetical protein
VGHYLLLYGKEIERRKKKEEEKGKAKKGVWQCGVEG